MNIKKATYIVSSPTVEKCPQPDRPEYAFIGRSNVGKSSLINMLVNQKALAKTSSTPGKTQMINHFGIESNGSEKSKNEQWYLVDLPGYGYAKVAKKERKIFSKMIQEYISKRKNLLHLFVLIDSRHSPQQIDMDFAEILYNNQIPFTLIFTKADKEKPGVVERNVKAFLDKLRVSWQFLPQTIVTSVNKKQGREEVLDLIAQLNQSA